MAELEKVIKGLDCEEFRKCAECPYVKFGKCNVLLIRDVRELLKEYKNEKERNPVIVCPHCGKRVK